MMSVLHIWDMYIPNLFDRTHPYWSKKGEEVTSFLVAGSLVETGASLYPRTHIFHRRAVGHASDPTLWQRITHKLFSPWREYRFRRFCGKKLGAIRPDIVHLHFGTTAAKLLPLLCKVNAPVFVSFYGMDASESLRVPSLRRKYKKVFQRAQRVLVLCEEVRRRMEALGCPKEKLEIWNLPAGIEDYPYQERVPSKTVRFLTCARFVEKKGYRYLLEAFEKVVARGQSVELTLMGYGPLKPNIEELQKSLESRGKKGALRIIDTELRPDFSEIFRRELEVHDVFILPSVTATNGDDEGGPALTLVCAQAAGLPVICTSFPGAEISVEEGVTGFFVRSGDSQDLAEKILYVAEHKDLWNRVGAAGSRKVWQEFSEEGQMDKLTSLYRRSLAEAPSRALLACPQ